MLLFVSGEDSAPKRKDVQDETKAVRGLSRSVDREAAAENREAKAENSLAQAQRKSVSDNGKSSNGNKSGGSTSSNNSSNPVSMGKWLTLTIFILGLLEYFIRINSTDLSSTPFVISCVLLLLGIVSISLKFSDNKYAVLLPVLFFMLWYFIYKSSIDPSFLVVFLSIFLALSTVLAFITKTGTITPELVGFIPVLFFFLDIGLLPLISDKLGLTPTSLLSSLILFMPWWALFGLFTIPEGTFHSSTLEGLFGFLKVGAILYIIFVLLIPAIPGLGHDPRSLIPETGVFEEAQAKFRVGQYQKENPAWSNLQCMFSDFQNVADCVAKRQEDSEISSFCKQQVDEGNYGTQEVCEIDQKKIREEQKNAAMSATATNFDKVSNAQFKLDTDKDPTSRVFSAVLIVDNPREQVLSVDAGCAIKRGTETVAGVINVLGKGATPLAFTDDTKEIPMTCTIAKDTPLGRYDVEFTATIHGLQTTSWVKRTFFKDEQERKRYQDRVLADQYASKADRLSQAPGEFARLNVEFGTLRDNPLLVVTQPAFLWVSMENTGKGRVGYVDHYELTTLREEGFSVQEGDSSCLEGGSRSFPEDLTKSSGNILFAKRCFLSVPSGYIGSATTGKTETFLASVTYDYTIKSQIAIEIKDVDELNLMR